MTIRTTLAAAIAALAVAAPVASAQPSDMHASTATAAAKAQQQSQRDLRSPDAADAALHPRSATLLDLSQHPRKSPVVVNAPGATVVDSQSQVPAGAARSVHAVSPHQLPAPASASDNGTDWVLIGLGAGLTLLVLGGIAALTSRSRTLPRTGATA